MEANVQWEILSAMGGRYPEQFFISKSTPLTKEEFIMTQMAGGNYHCNMGAMVCPLETSE
jgi:hypothetical protein